MDFAKAARMTSKFTRTENGALALNTTGDARLDLYATIGALRDADGERVCRLFSEAYREDPANTAEVDILPQGYVRCGQGRYDAV